MSTKLETIGRYESAKEAAKKMLDKNVSSLVVVDEQGQSIGIVTERDGLGLFIIRLEHGDRVK